MLLSLISFLVVVVLTGFVAFLFLFFLCVLVIVKTEMFIENEGGRDH
jgi:uncharacterized membrane protein YqiK